MPIVSFLHDSVDVEVGSGVYLPDVAAQAKATLSFGCRLGSCGTCRCLVVDGHENVNPLTDAERELFESLTSVQPNERLACQIVVHGDVKIQS